MMHITSKCTGCTACTHFCPVYAISGTKGQMHLINEKRCVSCGVCGRVCPSAAIVDDRGVTLKKLARKSWPKPRINKDICSACGICVTLCSPEALRIELPKEKGDILVSAELFQVKKCTGCGICAENCPIDAIVMITEEEDDTL